MLARGLLSIAMMLLGVAVSAHELQLVDSDLNRTLVVALVILPGALHQLARDSDLGALLQVLARDFSGTSEGGSPKPVGTLLRFTITVPVVLRNGDVEVCDGQALLGVTHVWILAEVADDGN